MRYAFAETKVALFILQLTRGYFAALIFKALCMYFSGQHLGTILFTENLASLKLCTLAIFVLMYRYKYCRNLLNGYFNIIDKLTHMKREVASLNR